MPPKFTSLSEKMEAYTDRSGGPDACWPWQRCKTSLFGYGRVWDSESEKSDWAHRVAWRSANGPIPDGMLVLHTCDNPLCVNPAHLFLGTDRDNMADKTAKGRGRAAAGERNGHAKLSEIEVKEMRACYANGNVSMAALARIFNVDRSTVSRIVRDERWKESL